MSPSARLEAIGWRFQEPRRAGGLCSASRRDGGGSISFYGRSPEALARLIEDYERSLEARGKAPK